MPRRASIRQKNPPVAIFTIDDDALGVAFVISQALSLSLRSSIYLYSEPSTLLAIVVEGVLGLLFHLLESFIMFP